MKLVSKNILASLNAIFEQGKKVTEVSELFTHNREAMILNTALKYHLRIFAFLDKHSPKKLQGEEKLFWLIILADVHFSHKLSKEEIVSDLNNFYISEHKLNLEAAQSLFNLSLQFNGLLPKVSKEEQESDAYFGLLYNLPPGLIKMWRKNINPRIFMPLLRKVNNDALPQVKLNIKDGKLENILTKPYAYKKGPVTNTFTYTGIDLENDAAFLNNEIYLHNFALEQALKYLPLKKGDECLIIDENRSNSVVDLSLTFSKQLKIDLALPSLQDELYFEQIDKYYDLSNVFLYKADHNLLITFIRSKKDAVIIFPKSSSFDKIRTEADFFVHFDMSKLDQIIAHQEATLNEAASHVIKGGHLLYLVDTFSNKESHALISEFLESNPNFTLVKEKQFLPFDKYDTIFYYALLKRKEDEDA